jgi:Ohr subfamily peroxiredoxin
VGKHGLADHARVPEALRSRGKTRRDVVERSLPAGPPGIEPGMKTLYTAVSTAHGGREGHVKSEDGVLDLALSVPKSMGGPGGSGSNPEQLFAAGYAACFESALRLVARLHKKPLQDARITARVSLNATDAGQYFLGVELHGHVEGLTTEETRVLMQAAHEVCPYSKATRGNVDVKLVAE